MNNIKQGSHPIVLRLRYIEVFAFGTILSALGWLVLQQKIAILHKYEFEIRTLSPAEPFIMVFSCIIIGLIFAVTALFFSRNRIYFKERLLLYIGPITTFCVWGLYSLFSFNSELRVVKAMSDEIGIGPFFSPEGLWSYWGYSFAFLILVVFSLAKWNNLKPEEAANDKAVPR